MSVLHPFRALRPAPEAAARVASVPYDVVSTSEARALASANPLSFLHVTRAEIDLPPDTPPYDARVYAQAVRNFEALKREAPLVQEAEPSLYLYRLRADGREQVGLAGCFSLDEYDRNLIKKHERTRREKEDDRTRHILELGAQTGIVFLTHPPSAMVTGIAARVVAERPLYDVAAPDQVSHTVWRVGGPEVDALVTAFASLPALYIADGHHRVASAARARETLRAGGRGPGRADWFIAAAFPSDQVRILPYNRIVRDLGGRSPGDVLAALRAKIKTVEGGPVPAGPGRVAMFLAGRWYELALAPPPPGTSRADRLDVEQLQRQILGPVLGVGDPRADTRIDFVGGVRGTAELERLVTGGQAAAAFSMHPVAVEDLMAVADEGAIMPPKSTWFEPKLRDGLLVHLI
jgi:uncharacterized protein (DUF1015 family)